MHTDRAPRSPSFDGEHRSLPLVLVLLLLWAPLSACVSQLYPVPPAGASPLTQMPAEVDVETSTVQLVVPVDFQELNRLLSESLPTEIAALRNITIASGLTGSFRLARSGNSILLATQGRLQVIIPLTLDIEATVSTRVLGFPVGHTERATTSFAIRIDTALTANESWEAQSESTIDYQIANADVGIGPARFDVRRLLDGQLRPYVNSLRDILDERLGAALDLRGRMQRLWPRVLQPIQVLDSPAVYMQLQPVEVQWVRPRMDSGSFMFGLGVAARVRTYMGSPPTLPEIPPLPALREVTEMGNAFHLSVPMQVPFSELTAQARAELVGSERVLDSGATIRITSVELRGASDGRVHILCGINAHKGFLRSAEGTLHMLGVPRYDPGTRVLRFEEVAYDLDTRNVLLRMANWAMHDDFLAGVQAALEFNVGESLDSTLAAVNESAANLVVSDQLTLHVALARVDIGPILVSDDAVVIVGLADGTVTADVSLFGRRLDLVPAEGTVAN
ncbi:MAG: DUF4403 family protein [Polyangiales bacterium]|nr:DUF4403 family protein [Myxococcales bacterium]MCB9661150.1 DUF4403 family protein [Sandaracinaceae bacterium]